MKRLTIIFAFILLISYLRAQDSICRYELSVTIGKQIGALAKNNQIVIGNYSTIQPSFFANFTDQLKVSFNYCKRNNQGIGIGSRIDYKSAQSHQFDRTQSNRFEQGSFSSVGLSFLYSKNIYTYQIFQIELNILPGVNYTSLKPGSDLYWVAGNSNADGDISLNQIFGVEHVIEQNILTPTLSGSIGGKAIFNENLQFRAAFGIETSLINSKIAPEKYSIGFAVELGLIWAFR